MLLNRPFSVITPTVDGDVLTVLGRTEQFLTAGGVHRIIGRWSVNGVRKALVRLSSHGLVVVETSGPVPLYALNREHLAAEAVVEIAHLPVRLVSRLRRELEEWEDPPSYAALLDPATRRDTDEPAEPADQRGALDVLLVRPRSLAQDSAQGWAADVAALRHAVSRWTGSAVRVHELSESELRQGLDERRSLLVAVRRDGMTLTGDEALMWRRPDAHPPVTGQ